MTSSTQLLNELLVQHCSRREKEEIKELIIQFLQSVKNKYDPIQFQLLDDYLKSSLTIDELNSRIDQVIECKLKQDMEKTIH